MGAVAEGRFFRVLAGAPGDGAGFGDFHFLRCPLCSLMGAVAERLFGGASAGTPPINTGRRGANDGRLLKDFRSCHSFAGWTKTRFCRLFYAENYGPLGRRLQEKRGEAIPLSFLAELRGIKYLSW